MPIDAEDAAVTDAAPIAWPIPSEVTRVTARIAPSRETRALFDVARPERYRCRIDVALDRRDWLAFMAAGYANA